jgi:chemotaxis protein MotB
MPFVFARITEAGVLEGLVMAMRKRHDEPENNDRWLVSYADFITLLFAFFAVLYATSQADIKKQEEFQESIKKQFSGFIGLGSGNEMQDLYDIRNKQLIRPIETFPPMGAGSVEMKAYVKKRLENEIPKEERGPLTEIHSDAVGVKIQLAASKLFDSGSAKLRPESALALDHIGKLLKETNRKIIIEGHTDDLPIHSSEYPSNWELSAARATMIVRYLNIRHKIPASQLVPVAYADQKPVVPNTSEENRAKNRRIEIKIVTGNADL